VKSTTFRRKGAYTANIVGPKRERYARGKLDFFAVYLVPIDLWYLIPFELVEKNLSLNLTPRKGHKFSQYMGVEFAAGRGEVELSFRGTENRNILDSAAALELRYQVCRRIPGGVQGRSRGARSFALLRMTRDIR
jgi:hypothetical protein